MLQYLPLFARVASTGTFVPALEACAGPCWRELERLGELREEGSTEYRLRTTLQGTEGTESLGAVLGAVCTHDDKIQARQPPSELLQATKYSTMPLGVYRGGRTRKRGLEWVGNGAARKVGDRPAILPFPASVTPPFQYLFSPSSPRTVGPRAHCSILSMM